MIQIDVSRIDDDKVKEFAENIYTSMQQEKRNEINNWLKSNFSRIGWGDKPFLELIQFDYERLLEIKRLYDANNYTVDSDSYFIKTLYGKIKKDLRKLIVDTVGALVCPYCNRNYIHSTYSMAYCENCDIDYFVDADNTCPVCEQLNVAEEVNTCQLDHFFAKSSYPILAVCFYNLIPICASCNRIKSNETFNVSPYDTRTTDDLLTFTYDLESIDRRKIKIDFKDNDDLKSDLQLIRVEELYQTHTDILDELRWKQSVYSKSYRFGLEKIISNHQLTNVDINRFITGVYTNQEDYHKRPLSKMVTDISRELGLLEGEE